MTASPNKRPLKILFVGTEAAPFAKVGGLGEVLFALPRALRQQGHDARVFIPKYASIKTKLHKLTPVIKGLRLGVSAKDPYGLTVANVLKNETRAGIVSYFLENMEYYEKRANVYGYADDSVRWVLLSRGVLEFLKRSDWVPDVIVANDWGAGFVPNLMATEYRQDPIISRIASVFVIHNLRNQGMFDVHFVKERDYDYGTKPIPDVLHKSIRGLNGMRRGILHADSIVAVSPTYAKEIMEPELGEKLDGALRRRRSIVTGILNGIDTKKYNPSTDRFITRNFSSKNPRQREANKASLQRIFKLPKKKDAFIMGFVGRLDEQKGFTLLMKILPSLLSNLNIQYVSVGTGEKEFRMFFKKLQEKFPKQVSAHLYFDLGLPKRIFAGADAILMPSRFEPSGLVQMEAMRYGCVPIARNTGGLADTVINDTPGGEGNGFLFEDYDHMSLMIAIVRAYTAFTDTRRWDGIVRRGLEEDFSWDVSAEKHAHLYRQAISRHRSRRRQL